MMMIFNMSTSYFSHNFISLFWGLFHHETDLKGKGSVRNTLLKLETLRGGGGVWALGWVRYHDAEY